MPLSHGIGLVPGNFSPHAAEGSDAADAVARLVADNALPAGYAVGDDAALHLVDGVLTDVLFDRAGGSAMRVERLADGVQVEALSGRVLGGGA